jgi:hypothetical protein
MSPHLEVLLQVVLDSAVARISCSFMTTRKLSELFRAIASEDVVSARALASQICREQEQMGHRSAARLLRGALSTRNGSHGTGTQNGIVPANGVLPVSSALVRLSADTPLASVVLEASARRELHEIVREWNHRAKLRDRGLSPRSRLLFHGPPGCGKSLTARALATELRLPAYLVRFDAVIGAYLGQTAIHLRQLFHFAEVTPCILLLDELDALGKRRGNPLDVGELDRIVIALMQELEHTLPAGLIIGTSNMPKHLDDALWRRFDLTLKFPSPRQTTLKKYAKGLARGHNVSPTSAIMRRAQSASSFADAEAIIVAEARRQVLGNV